MRPRALRGLLCLSILAIAAAPALAQRTTGEIIGKVIDESGADSARRDRHASWRRRCRSADGGHVGDRRLPVSRAAAWHLRPRVPRWPGSRRVRREGIPVAVGATVELDVTLTVGDPRRKRSRSPANRRSSASSTAQVSTTYNKEWVQNAPLRRFSYFDLIMSAPGISQTSQRRIDHDGHVARLEHEREPVPDRRHRDQRDAVAEHRRRRGGRGAAARRVGRVRQRAGRGVQHRHPQGGNALHGDANVYFQNDALTGRNTTAAFDNGRPYHLDEQRDVTVQVSGPFIKDKFWFFGSLAVPPHLRFAAGRRSGVAVEVGRAPGVLEVQLQHHAEPSAAARLPRRLLLDSRRHDRVRRAEHDHARATDTTRRRTSSTRASCPADTSSRALLRLLAAGLRRSERRRTAVASASATRIRTPG